MPAICTLSLEDNTQGISNTCSFLWGYYCYLLKKTRFLRSYHRYYSIGFFKWVGLAAVWTTDDDSYSCAPKHGARLDHGHFTVGITVSIDAVFLNVFFVSILG